MSALIDCLWRQKPEEQEEGQQFELYERSPHTYTPRREDLSLTSSSLDLCLDAEELESVVIET